MKTINNKKIPSLSRYILIFVGVFILVFPSCIFFLSYIDSSYLDEPITIEILTRNIKRAIIPSISASLPVLITFYRVRKITIKELKEKEELLKEIEELKHKNNIEQQ